MPRLKFRVSKEQDGLRLDHAIADTYSKDLSRSTVRKLIVAGAVYLNGKRIRVASRLLKAGAVVDVYWDPKKESSPLKKSFDEKNFLPLKVLYEDEAIICFDKPAGLPTQPTLDEARANLYALAKKQYGYLGMHHRLDRDTSGVVIFTRDQKHNAFISEQFRDHLCSKTYIAVVHGKLQNPKGRIESFLDEVKRQGKQAKYGSVRSGGKKAITDYTVLQSGEKASLVEVSLLTGRTHQIRVHFSEMGHPIVGDPLYGTSESNLGRHLLHASALTIEHPVSHHKIRIESPVPGAFREWVANPH